MLYFSFNRKEGLNTRNLVVITFVYKGLPKHMFIYTGTYLFCNCKKYLQQFCCEAVACSISCSRIGVGINFGRSMCTQWGVEGWQQTLETVESGTPNSIQIFQKGQIAIYLRARILEQRLSESSILRKGVAAHWTILRFRKIWAIWARVFVAILWFYQRESAYYIDFVLERNYSWLHSQ